MRPSAVSAGWAGAEVALAIYVVLLLGLHRNYVVGPLAAVGSPTLLWGLVLLGWWTLSQLTRRQSVKRTSVVPWLMLAMMAVVVMSYAAAMARGLPGDEISVADTRLIQMLSWLGVVLFAADGIASREAWRRVLKVFALMMGVVMAIVLAQIITGQMIIDIEIPGLRMLSPIMESGERGGFARVSGTSGTPIELGQVVAMGIGPVVALALGGVRRAWLYRLVAVLSLVGLFLVISRAALLSGLIAGVVLFPILTRAQRWLSAVMVVLATVAVFVTQPGLLGTITNLFTGISGDPSAQSRTDSYDLAWKVFENFPWLGRGPGTFLPRYRIVDNEWLIIALELGVIGVLVTVLLFAGTAWEGVRASRRAKARLDALGYRGCVAALAAGVTGMLFFDSYSFPQAAGVIFLMVGLIAAATRLESR